MPSLRPRVSQKVLNELILKVRQDDPLRQPPSSARERLKAWATRLIGGAWIVLLIATPFLLVLLLFGHNYTANWLIALAWLMGISFVATGLYKIVDWIDQSLHHGQPKNSSLVLGIALLMGTICAAFLLLQGTNDDLPPLATVGAMTLLGVILCGWGVYRLVTERQTGLIFRVVSLIGMLSIGVCLIIGGLSLKYAALGIAPEVNQKMQTLMVVLSAIFWGTTLVSYKPSKSEVPQRRQTNELLVVVIALLIVLLFIMLPHPW